MSNNLDFKPYLLRNNELGQSENMLANPGQEKLLSPNKRKATAELSPSSYTLQKTAVPNKRAALVGSSPKVSEALPKSPRMGLSSKKVVHVEPVMNKSHQAVSSSAAFDSVRVKLRESLTAALELVSQHTENSLDAGKKSENEATIAIQEGEFKSLESASSTASTTKIGSVTDSCGYSSPDPSNKCNDFESVSQEVHLKDMTREEPQGWKFVGQEFETYPVLPGEGAAFGDGFFFKDDLLQGNGLSWALDLDTQIPKVQEVESTQKDELTLHNVSEDEKEQVDQLPESLALKIEAELFKLFGGVNKKYKEKGRSLLFNLKDRNNPDLRERVMSGEISPERLCSMTAEELASKELSEWRMAKAEELAQMKVLPDSDIGVRRLVKKTHKGEYQVEFDQDYPVVEDVSINAGVMPLNCQKKSSNSAAFHNRKTDDSKEARDGQCRITIPVDGADMQGLMVDDMGDLPPIVSLDEFMDSLDKEPPFEHLPVDPGVTKPVSNKESSAVDMASKSPLEPAKDPIESTLPNKEAQVESLKPNANVKSAVSQRGTNSNTNNRVHLIKMEHIWEGTLQLSLSSNASVLAIYKSGEKTSTKDWPGFFEIKGRVRLDPFDKFLQELPMSRSRAIMVAHFVLKEGCADSEHTDLQELIDSYMADQRLGFAEPAPGVELYLCPPRSKPVDMVINHLSKEYTENINDLENGLIGILVWRKEPNPLQHKVTVNKQPMTPGRQHTENDMIHRNVNFASKVALPLPTISNPVTNDDDDGDGDVPPGFGPPDGVRDDDDLPEFNFSGGTNPTRSHISQPNSSGQRIGTHRLRPGAPSMQVEQMRELIHKYGGSGGIAGHGIPVQPWNNDDDDDDIPEWEPQAPRHQQSLPPLPHHPTQNSALMPHANRPFFQQPLVPLAKPMQPLQPPMIGRGAWWPSGPNNLPPIESERINGQFSGAPVPGRPMRRDWRPPNGSSRNRGF